MSKTVVVTLPEMPEHTLILDIEGEAMLQNRLTEEAIAVIKKEKKAGDKEDYTQKSKKWKATGHYNKAGKLGFPAEGFMKSIATAMKGVDLSHKKELKFPKDLHRSMHIESDDFDQTGNGIVLFTKGEPEMSEHIACIPGQNKQIPVYRTLVRAWAVSLRVVYNSALLTPQDIILLANRAGLGIGIGAFRAENRGPYGMFRVVGARLMENTPRKKVA